MNEHLKIRFKELSNILVSQRNENGFWSGELSSSALGVAVAVAALHFNDKEVNRNEISLGLNWLRDNMNIDGSYGDTPESPGNISTSLLVYAALNLYSHENQPIKNQQSKIAEYLKKNNIDIYSNQVSHGILAHYKRDYTFSVPILTMCALCGIPQKNAFRNIPQLPFELALLPRKFYRLLNLSVVSYAIPALIAVGIVIFKKKNSGILSKRLRGAAEKKALKLLEKLMPASGGFLEAIPLTAFVTLSIINAGYGNSNVVNKGIAFLKQQQRKDGGFPIDVDLSTWVTTLSIKALQNRKDDVLSNESQKELLSHLKAVQNKTTHPFNGTMPGGWGWTNFSGSVPDGDDTPGAILALMSLGTLNTVKNEILAGGNWLLKLQNNDGGFPTFSRGWGKLPFDQSCADLTGHCFLALAKILNNYGNEITISFKRKLYKSLEKALLYLKKHQKEDGAWLPLWFGNQQTKNHDNPVYGTARVTTYLNDSMLILNSDTLLVNQIHNMVEKAETYLLAVQNKDGSWGGAKGIPGTIEETALAISALQGDKFKNEKIRGFKWLNRFYKEKGLKSAPIGLYFASLWYDEKMYPITTYLEAIVRNLND